MRLLNIAKAISGIDEYEAVLCGLAQQAEANQPPVSPRLRPSNKAPPSGQSVP
jgi:hypothetical protein